MSGEGGSGGKKFQDCNMIVYNKNIIVTVFVIVWLRDEYNMWGEFVCVPLSVFE